MPSSLPFLSALSLLLRSSRLDVFLCADLRFFSASLLPNFICTISFFFSLLPLPLNLHLYFFCSPGIFCLWAAVSLLYTEEYLLSVILFCMLFFSHSLCVGGALPPPSSFFSFSSAPSPYQAWLTIQLFLQLSSSSGVSLFFLCLLTYFIFPAFLPIFLALAFFFFFFF